MVDATTERAVGSSAPPSPSGYRCFLIDLPGPWERLVADLLESDKHLPDLFRQLPANSRAPQSATRRIPLHLNGDPCSMACNGLEGPRRCCMAVTLEDKAMGRIVRNGPDAHFVSSLSVPVYLSALMPAIV